MMKNNPNYLPKTRVPTEWDRFSFDSSQALFRNRPPPLVIPVYEEPVEGPATPSPASEHRAGGRTSDATAAKTTVEHLRPASRDEEDETRGSSLFINLEAMGLGGKGG